MAMTLATVKLAIPVTAVFDGNDACHSKARYSSHCMAMTLTTVKLAIPVTAVFDGNDACHSKARYSSHCSV